MTAEKALFHLREWYKRDKTGEVDSVACVEAFNALEKQMPKKPIHFTKLINDYTHYCVSCPACKTVILFAHPYCSKCGQALDWSD